LSPNDQFSAETSDHGQTYMFTLTRPATHDFHRRVALIPVDGGCSHDGRRFGLGEKSTTRNARTDPFVCGENTNHSFRNSNNACVAKASGVGFYEYTIAYKRIRMIIRIARKTRRFAYESGKDIYLLRREGQLLLNRFYDVNRATVFVQQAFTPFYVRRVTTDTVIRY